MNVRETTIDQTEKGHKHSMLLPVTKWSLIIDFDVIKQD